LRTVALSLLRLWSLRVEVLTGARLGDGSRKRVEGHGKKSGADLKSSYEGEHTIFGLLSLAGLTQNDVLQFHPFTCK
jgi:hypothetical protein